MSFTTSTTVPLADWHFARIEAEDGSHIHLLGYVAGTDRPRITTTLRSFDPRSNRVRTESGRVYRLVGLQNPKAAEVALAAWLAEEGVVPEAGSLVQAEAVAMHFPSDLHGEM